MPNPQNKPHALRLTVLTPMADPVELVCDSLCLPLREDRKGEGGGSVGIRPGHAEAILSLGRGRLLAKRDGEAVLAMRLGEGFATVSHDAVTVTCESAEKYQ